MSSIYCRWLDESDGETGIEQELILSDILVADEEVKQEELLGNEVPEIYYEFVQIILYVHFYETFCC